MHVLRPVKFHSVKAEFYEVAGRLCVTPLKLSSYTPCLVILIKLHLMRHQVSLVHRSRYSTIARNSMTWYFKLAKISLTETSVTHDRFCGGFLIYLFLLEKNLKQQLA